MDRGTGRTSSLIASVLILVAAGVAFAQVPANDECLDAITLAVPSATAGSTTNASFQPLADCGTSITAPGVWYRVVGTGKELTASTCNAANYDTKISVFCGGCPVIASDCCVSNGSAGCDDATCETTVCAADPFCCNVTWDSLCGGEAQSLCGNLCNAGTTCVGGEDDSAGCGVFTTRFTWCSQADTEYLVLVHGFGGSVGDFTLSLTEGTTACTGAVDCTAGACCVAGECQKVSPSECDALGGIFTSIGTECSEIDCERPHPGWNTVDVGIALTGHQPTYWSAATGGPAGVAPFTILDPGPPPGRPALDGSGDRVLRGYLLAWAVNVNGEEIRWNHLKGDAVIVNYAKGTAWEYTTYAFQVVNPALGNGAPTGTAGTLFLNGFEYDRGYDLLLLDFYASGSQPFGLNLAFALDTDLTLLPLDLDLRQETDGPVTTKASFTVWNQNEVKLTGLDCCVTCWDQTLLSQYAAPNHFLRDNLQTDKGKAQIDGLASQLCDIDFDPGDDCTKNFGGPAPGCDRRDVLSQAASLLGVAAKQLDFSAPGPNAAAGMNLIGMGTQSAVIRFDLSGGPPPERVATRSRIRLAQESARQLAEDESQPSAATSRALPATDRTSASQKGSLLIYPKVELRWNNTGTTLVQDTFIDLTNDFPGTVLVQMYFINGDAPTDLLTP